MSEPAYLRQPTLHGDSIVFVSDDDLWLASTRGGIARRLTAGLSEPSTPCLSPDGRWLAYIGRDEQHPEVHLMPADGGPSRRLTWLGPDTLVRGWTPQGHILFVSTWGQPFFRNHQAFTLDPAGGMPQPLGLGQVNHLAFGPGGARVIGRNTADPARWKRYRGGTAGHLWIDADGSGHFRRMSELQGNLSCPMWIGERVYFLSDAEGVGNLYSCLPRRQRSCAATPTMPTATRAMRRATAGASSTNAPRSCGCCDPARGEHHALDIEVPSPRTQAARRFVPAEAHVGAAQLHPAGHSLAARRARQALHHAAVGRRGAPARRGRRRALPPRPVAGRRQTLLVVSDASGEERHRAACRRRGARARLGHRPCRAACAPRRWARAWRWPTTATSC